MARLLGSKRFLAALLLGGLALAAGGLALVNLGRAPSESGLSLAEGARLYGLHCAACHGANLEGEPNWRQRRADGMLPAPPQDASGHTWHHPDPQLLAIVKQGTAALVGGDYKSNMRGFAGELSDDEIRAVLAYIRSRWPADIQAKQAEITRRAQ
jgi:mono/diheme cytochrome c family protein